MAFRSTGLVAFVSGKDLIEVIRRIEYWDSRSKQLFIIPVGFVCDGASLPPALYGVIGSPFDFTFRLAAVLHDFLYRYGSVSKKKADQIFYDAMRETGVGYFKAQSMYLAVKFFGASSYNRKRGDENEVHSGTASRS